ncbi:MAG: PDZ domain-containing protein [Pirellulales bacterium]|nr:PDZ domain-containing protein [Pirellulales bacterium]
MMIRSGLVFVALVSALAGVGRGADDLEQLEQKAFQAAVSHVGPSVVRIETVGGRERLGKMLLGTGPTTGLVVDADGYIISSAFNFLRRPDSILVQLPDDTRKPARLIATDHSRNLVLLKIDVPSPLPVPDLAKRSQMRVGQWTVAVGRTFPGNRPNVSVGILSALNRVWGKAIQTDAATSPSNYGGPLIDLQGRVLGMLAPLSPRSREIIGGSEWYDSGIGFAVVVEDVMAVLPRLKQGKDLYAGLMGINIGKGDPNTAPPVIAACQPGSPAAKAGLLAGDRIVRINGQPVQRANDVTEILGRLYAGDVVEMVVRRKGKELTKNVTLIEKLTPYQLPALGILPMRTPADAAARGVAVRDVLPGLPAAKAKIARGDVLLKLDKTDLKNADQLRQLLAQREPGESVELTIQRGSEVRKQTVQLGAWPETLPQADPPSAYSGVPSADSTKADEKPAVGRITVKVPEQKKAAWGYVPSGYTAARPAGLIVWLAEPGMIKDEILLARFMKACDKHNVILLAPKPSGDPNKWTPTEEDEVVRVLDELLGRYAVDRNRIAVGGRGTGGALAFKVAFAQRELVRAVAVIDAVPAARPPENDPVHRLTFYVSTATKSSQTPKIDRIVTALRKMKYPVVTEKYGDVAGPPKPDQIERLARWIDTLDRI